MARRRGLARPLVMTFGVAAAGGCASEASVNPPPAAITGTTTRTLFAFDAQRASACPDLCGRELPDYHTVHACELVTLTEPTPPVALEPSTATTAPRPDICPTSVVPIAKVAEMNTCPDDNETRCIVHTDSPICPEVEAFCFAGRWRRMYCGHDGRYSGVKCTTTSRL